MLIKLPFTTYSATEQALDYGGN